MDLSRHEPNPARGGHDDLRDQPERHARAWVFPDEHSGHRPGPQPDLRQHPDPDASPAPVPEPVRGVARHDLFMHNGSINYRFLNGVPNQLTLTDAPWNFEESVRDIALYVQDQWTFRRLTLNAGLRYSDAKARTPEEVLGAGFFVPERRFAPVDDIPHYRNLSPRIGFAYDLFGTGRTAVKASLGHYPDRIIQASANPAVNLTRTTSRNWGDSTTNYRPDCDLLNSAASGECGAWSNLNFGKANAETRYAADARSGFNGQFHNWQGSVALQHELRPGLG